MQDRPKTSNELLSQPADIRTAPHAFDTAAAADAVSSFLKERKVDAAVGAEAATSSAPAVASEALSGRNIEEEIRQAEQRLNLMNLAPEIRYQEILKREKIDIEEARKIVDTVILLQKPWRETIRLHKRLAVVLQTRSVDDQSVLARGLEASNPQFNLTIQAEISRRNLAASIVSYGDVVFERTTSSDLQKIASWVEALPQPLFVLLSQKLYEFDKKIDLVFSEGYLENF